MFEITINFMNGNRKSICVCDDDLAYFWFSRLILAVDVKSIVVTDGLTGEVLKEFQNF